MFAIDATRQIIHDVFGDNIDDRLGLSIGRDWVELSAPYPVNDADTFAALLIGPDLGPVSLQLDVTGLSAHVNVPRPAGIELEDYNHWLKISCCRLLDFTSRATHSKVLSANPIEYPQLFEMVKAAVDGTGWHAERDERSIRIRVGHVSLHLSMCDDRWRLVLPMTYEPVAKCARTVLALTLFMLLATQGCRLAAPGIDSIDELIQPRISVTGPMPLSQWMLGHAVSALTHFHARYAKEVMLIAENRQVAERYIDAQIPALKLEKGGADNATIHR